MWLRRITTSVGSGPASGCTPGVICMVLSSASTVRRQVFLALPLLRFPSGVQWRAVRVMLSCSLLMKCPIHLHRLRMMMGSPCCLDCIERVAVDWRWCQAKGCAGFSWGSLCGKLTAWWCCSLSSCGIQSFIVGWKSHSFCRSSTWSWCCTVRTSTRCWDGSWCHSLLLHHALLLCPVKWTLQLLAGLLLSLGLVKDWTRSAASLLSSLCWSLDQLAVRKCWVRSSFPACVGVYGRLRLNHMQNLSPPALRRESIWCPETDLLLCASLTSQWSCCRASPTLHSLFWRQTSLQSWFRCCLLYMWSCCSSFWWCR